MLARVGGRGRTFRDAEHRCGRSCRFAHQASVSLRQQELWEQTGLESIDTRVIHIPVVYSSFDDFWCSNSVPIGPQGKLINGMSPETRELLRTRLRDNLPITSDGRIVYEAFANAVKGQVAA